MSNTPPFPWSELETLRERVRQLETSRVALDELERKHCRCDAMRGVTCSLHADIAAVKAARPEERRFDCHLIQDAPPYHWNTCKAWCGDFRCPQEERRDKERRCAPSPQLDPK